MSKELYACELTAKGRGAVSVIGLRGHLALADKHFRAVNGLLMTEQPAGRVSFGHWGDLNAEEVLVTRLTDHECELHCHGGTAAVQRILRDLQEEGTEVLQIPQWLQQTLAPIDAEFQALCSQAVTRRTAHLLLRQSQLFPSAIRQLANQNNAERLTTISEILQWADFGRHCLEPRKVVLCGRPNVGKSQLINAILGFERAVVFDQPGTTRDVLTAETAIDGWPFEFSDTAGLRHTESELEAAGIKLAEQRLSQADLRIYVIDACDGLTEADRTLRDQVSPHFSIWNKIDLAEANSVPEGELGISALQNVGITTLLEEITQSLIPALPDNSRPFPVSASQVARLLNLQAALEDNDLTRFEQELNSWCNLPA